MNAMDPDSTGQRIARARRRRGLSQAALAGRGRGRYRGGDRAGHDELPGGLPDYLQIVVAFHERERHLVGHPGAGAGRQLDSHEADSGDERQRCER